MLGDYVWPGTCQINGYGFGRDDHVDAVYGFLSGPVRTVLQQVLVLGFREKISQGNRNTLIHYAITYTTFYITFSMVTSRLPKTYCIW